MALTTRISKVLAECESRLQRSPSILDWNTGMELAKELPEHNVFSPAGAERSLPYLDESIDVVELVSAEEHAIAEARRIAATAVVNVSKQGRDNIDTLTVEWKTEDSQAEMPRVSVVLPATDDIEKVEGTLRAVLETLPENFAGEVIIVDDGNAGTIVRRLQLLAQQDQRVTLLRNDRPAGFAACCNRAARLAKGEIVALILCWFSLIWKNRPVELATC